VPDLAGISPYVNVVAALFALAAIPWFARMRPQPRLDRNDLAGVCLLGLAFLLNGGFKTLLRSSPTALMAGSFAGSSNRAHSANVWISGSPPNAASHESPSRHLHISWSTANRLPRSFWGEPVLLKCKYRVWDGEITHITGVPVDAARAHAAWEWDSGSGSPLWYSLEGVGGLVLALLSVVSFRRPSLRAPEFPNKCVKVAYFGALVAVGGWVVYVTSSDWLLKLKAEALLSRIQGLELRKSTWKDAESIRKAFGGEPETGSSCSPAHCDFTVRFEHAPVGYDSLGEALSEMFRLAGRRWAKVRATVRVRNGIVWGKDFWVATEIPGAPGCGFIATAETARGFRLLRRSPDTHPYIDFGAPGGCDCCTMRWVHVTPYASAEEMREAFSFDLSCLGPRLRACRDVARLHPAAARRFKEQRADCDPDSPRRWTPELLHRLGRVPTARRFWLSTGLRESHRSR
jgi:hypothetical protein